MAGRDAARRRRERQGWARALDAALDAGLVAFAGWTLFYEAALAGQWSVLLPGAVWLVLASVGSGWWIWHSVRSDRFVEGSSAPRQPGRWPVPWLVYGTGVLALVLAVLNRSRWGVETVAVVAVVTIGGALWSTRRQWSGASAEGPGSDVDDGAAATGAWADAVALVASVGLAALAVFLLRTDADDAYYVNRATWVAQHGVPVLKDTMFSPGVLGSTYPGLPLPSVEALQGSMAHLFRVQAPTMAYEVFVPILSFAFGWTTWRLLRSWARRRALLAFAVAMVFVLLSASSVVGNYSIGRIWQGKVVAFTIVLPLAWYYLGRLAARGASHPRRMQVLLLAAGVAFVGLTSSSALQAPVIGGSALVAALLLRRAGLALGALAFLVGPIVAGLLIGAVSGQVGVTASPVLPAKAVFAIMVGAVTVMALLGVIGLVFGPTGTAPDVTVLLLCGSLATLTALLPGIFDLVDVVTGAGPVAWRLAIGMPSWVLVGLLVAVPPAQAAPHTATQRARRAIGPATAAAVAGVIVAASLSSGTLLWSDRVNADLTGRPTWKVGQEDLADVRALQQRSPARGVWLLPPGQMLVLSISDTRYQAVVPRIYYLPDLPTDARDHADREALYSLVTSGAVDPPRVRTAMERLRVSVACVPRRNTRARSVLSAAVGNRLTPIRRMACYWR